MKHPAKPSPTWKIHTFASKHVGWNLGLEQTSSNIIQHDFFLLFRNFINFVIAQAIPTFHPTWQKRDVGWNIGLVCSGLYTSISCSLFISKSLAIIYFKLSRDLVFEVFKSFILQVHGKKTKYFNWSSITSDVQW